MIILRRFYNYFNFSGIKRATIAAAAEYFEKFPDYVNEREVINLQGRTVRKRCLLVCVTLMCMVGKREIREK